VPKLRPRPRGAVARVFHHSLSLWRRCPRSPDDERRGSCSAFCEPPKSNDRPASPFPAYVCEKQFASHPSKYTSRRSASRSSAANRITTPMATTLVRVTASHAPPQTRAVLRRRRRIEPVILESPKGQSHRFFTNGRPSRPLRSPSKTPRSTLILGSVVILLSTSTIWLGIKWRTDRTLGSL